MRRSFAQPHRTLISLCVLFVTFAYLTLHDASVSFFFLPQPFSIGNKFPQEIVYLCAWTTINVKVATLFRNVSCCFSEIKIVAVLRCEAVGCDGTAAVSKPGGPDGTS